MKQNGKWTAYIQHFCTLLTTKSALHSMSTFIHLHTFGSDTTGRGVHSKCKSAQTNFDWVSCLKTLWQKDKVQILYIIASILTSSQTFLYTVAIQRTKLFSILEVFMSIKHFEFMEYCTNSNVKDITENRHASKTLLWLVQSSYLLLRSNIHTYSKENYSILCLMQQGPIWPSSFICYLQCYMLTVQIES